MSILSHRRIHKGFTIVELIISITVIGILAGIVVVSYNGGQKKAQDTSVRADLEAIAGHLEAGRVRNTPANFASTEAELEALDIKIAKNAYDTTIAYNMIYCVLTTPGAEQYQAFTLVAKSKSGNIFKIDQDGFKTHTLTQSDLTASLCSTFSQTLVSNGMTTGGVWKTWARSG